MVGYRFKEDEFIIQHLLDRLRLQLQHKLKQLLAMKKGLTKHNQLMQPSNLNNRTARVH